ncbi:hypothetical protein TCAL_17404 [Tigriopus californicus]|uniref:Pro-resilin n=1 Tax=Tigriopus californicus TaxID=6832 RepID=A0A553PFH5_TIGCA|nr:pro-resilin-like [Tigriopus californicus]TRY76431.1 hypothetical protein TCAL_17404 [Tigriopus californicus]
MNSMTILACISAAVLVNLSSAQHPGAGAPHHGGVKGHHDGPAHYNYAYAVQDDYSGSNFGQSEQRDGYSTSGQYHVALPDGRIQTVTYTVADQYSGYVADVSYSGQAKYGPSHGPSHGHAHSASTV